MAAIGKDFFSTKRAVLARWPKQFSIQCRILTPMGSEIMSEAPLSEADAHFILKAMHLWSDPSGKEGTT